MIQSAEFCQSFIGWVKVPWIQLALMLFALIVATPPATAAGNDHPYHISIAEVDWNPKTKKFEVALGVWPADLEKALGQLEGRTIDLAKEPGIDKKIEAYVSSCFLIQKKTADAQLLPTKRTGNSISTGQASVPVKIKVSQRAKSPKITWYGHEADAKEAWLYFEIDGEVADEWSFENRMFFELNGDQLNHVQWSGTGQTQTLVVNPNQPQIGLPTRPPNPVILDR